MKGNARFIVYRTLRGLRWKLLAPNNEVVARGGEPFKLPPEPNRKQLRDALMRIRRSIRRVQQYAVLGHVDVRIEGEL